MIFDKKKLKGMTLIEVLLYLAIFGMFFVVIINYFFFVQDNNQLSGEALKIDRGVILLSQHFEDSFERTSSIGGSTIFNNNNGALYLTGPSNINYTVSDFATSDARLQFFDGAITKQITRNDVEVTKFLLEEILDNSDTNIGVEITVGIRSKSDTSISTEFTNSYIFD
ncbi:MAG TPA: prepilin-type N-terminal cleavage/methylation domain-containing protein [Candidatus Dojkabacteria bacterium]|nr:prepilin-type N-terminal cleavage/methylation domain-containing protein [Candidatus Dojkabacteria bacterium]HRO64766.1 prepilin-type N-terminal cleavage/methylation domain-containing protein [Candidatus Dojkabacteria bacterium]